MIFISSQVSDGNMDFRFGPTQEVLQNRKKFFEKWVRNDEIAELEQIHSNKVVVVKEHPDPNTKGDALISNNPNFVLMVKVADCIPVGLYDPQNKAIGLIHAGSKGLQKGIIKNAIQKMKKHFGSNPKNLLAKLGPSIGPCHYRLNIWQEAEKQLIDCGILKENMDNPKICTYENMNYFSHRRAEDTNQKEGRFVTILGLKNVN